MPMTRHSARSSFTFEIKRASRPTPEVLTRRKTSFPASPSLADQVFGKFSEPPTAPESPRFEVPSSDRLPSQSGSLGTSSRKMREVSEPSRQPTPRRVLPDLSSAPENPIEERLRQEADERAARRRATRGSRVEVGQGALKKPAALTLESAPAQDDVLDDSSSMSVRDEASAAEPLALALDEPVNPPARTSVRRSRASAHLKATCRRATKQGQPQPRLPAGSRWKRRLPWTCW
jgi:hypothetical protein